jgi:hypothetical protein
MKSPSCVGRRSIYLCYRPAHLKPSLVRGLSRPRFSSYTFKWIIFVTSNDPDTPRYLSVDGILRYKRECQSHSKKTQQVFLKAILVSKSNHLPPRPQYIIINKMHLNAVTLLTGAVAVLLSPVVAQLSVSTIIADFNTLTTQSQAIQGPENNIDILSLVELEAGLGVFPVRPLNLSSPSVHPPFYIAGRSYKARRTGNYIRLQPNCDHRKCIYPRFDSYPNNLKLE